MARDRSLEDRKMKKLSLIAGVTALAAVTGVLWSVPAAADMCGMAPCARAAHAKWPVNRSGSIKADDADDAATGMPEPGTMALLALGFGGLGLSALRRKRKS